MSTAPDPIPLDAVPRRGRPRSGGDQADTIKAVDRAVAILIRVSELGDVSLSVLAKDMDLPASTVLRVLNTLEQRQMVELDPDRQMWHIGSEAFHIGSQFLRRTSVFERARPIMRRMMEETGETANLGVDQGTYVLFVGQVETQSSIRAFFAPGTKAPIHASGIGKAILAHLAPDMLDTTLRSLSFDPLTDKTHLSQASLLADLQQIRDRGYSVDDEEATSGMRCVAAPVFDAYGTAVAGISVSGPTSRITNNAIQEVSGVIVNGAAELSAALGWRR